MKILTKLYKSTVYSIDGLVYAFKQELAFRLEIITCIILFPAAFFIAFDMNQLFWMLTTLFLILIVELGNTAIEATVDRIGIEQHILSKHAKDAASAAVLLSIILTSIVWLFIIYNNFFKH